MAQVAGPVEGMAIALAMAMGGARCLKTWTSQEHTHFRLRLKCLVGPPSPTEALDRVRPLIQVLSDHSPRELEGGRSTKRRSQTSKMTFPQRRPDPSNE
jgi:hypothetical protein